MEIPLGFIMYFLEFRNEKLKPYEDTEETAEVL